MDEEFLNQLFGMHHDAGGKVKIKVANDVMSFATFSDCKKYRFTLLRIWDESLPLILFVMMNPSTADENVNDPTVAKCMRYARKWGYGGLYIGNVCAYRATDKKALLDILDPVGAINILSVMDMAKKADLTIIAHGQLPNRLQFHADNMCDKLRESEIKLHVLKLSKDGIPCHPLFLSEQLIPEAWQ